MGNAVAASQPTATAPDVTAGAQAEPVPAPTPALVDPATDTGPPFDIGKRQNISSDELENSEVDKIADELRHRLKDTSKSEGTALLSAVPMPTLTPPPVAKPPTEGEIFIDHDGNLTQSDVPPPTPN